MTKTTCKCESQVSEEEILQQFKIVLNEFKDRPGGLIPALQTAQNMLGYIPISSMKMISKALNEPMSKVFGVVTFYSFFSRNPRGKYLVRVCLGTACYVRGANDVLDALKKELKIGLAETTEDRLFSLDIGRCFGACGLAPVIMVNDDTHRQVKPGKISEIVNTYRDIEQGGADNV